MNNMDKMLNMLSGKLGIDGETLKSSIEKGDAGKILGNLKPEDAGKVKNLMQNREALEKIMKSPQAIELMKKLNKK